MYRLFLHPKFGRSPKGIRLQKIESSPYYINSSFRNIENTPMLVEGYSFFRIMYEFLFKKEPGRIPSFMMPSQKSDLSDIVAEEDILVWFGHSSYFMKTDGKNILVDPVLSRYASPVSFIARSFRGTSIFTADDIPDIDYLFITHDHWDHLDYHTIRKIKPKVKKIICGLGTGEHLEYWRFDKSIIIEEDWNKKISLEDGFIVHTVTSRHFSGRGFKRNKTLWTSFVLLTPSMKIFLGCDGGYGKHFSETGKIFGNFDLAILENGQYDRRWRYIHMSPEEVIKAAKDLNAKMLIPIHSSKFALANHPWSEPLTRITELNDENKLKIITPMIGEKVNLKNKEQKFSEWWQAVK